VRGNSSCGTTKIPQGEASATMRQITEFALSRRRLLKAAGAAALTAGTAPAAVNSRQAKAQGKTLKIMQWKHFVPAFDRWFNDVFAKEWGKKNDIEVTVDNVGFGDMVPRAKAEIQAQRGHDLVLFLPPIAEYEDQVIDHREIYEECQHRYGKLAEFAIKSTHNPRTGKYFGVCATYLPAVISYRKHLWEAVQLAPSSWENILAGGRRIKLLHGSPVGFSLTPAEQNSEQTMRAIMYSFGSSEQDENGNATLKSKETLEAIKYVKALYQEAMIKDVLSWGSPSNNQFILSGDGCLSWTRCPSPGPPKPCGCRFPTISGWRKPRSALLAGSGPLSGSLPISSGTLRRTSTRQSDFWSTTRGACDLRSWRAGFRTCRP
jgi:multiple sugar transport system substrate-binding protein